MSLPLFPHLLIDPYLQSPQNGAWNVVNKKFHTPERLGVWSVVNFELSIPEQVVENFARNLQVCCNKLGEFYHTSCPFAISYLFNLVGMGMNQAVAGVAILSVS